DLHAALAPPGSMVMQTRDQLDAAVDEADGTLGHSIHDLLAGTHSGVATDVAETGAPTPEPSAHITTTAVYLGREAAHDDLVALKAQNDADGRLGERFVNGVLEQQAAMGT